jgi:hypothetical protein
MSRGNFWNMKGSLGVLPELALNESWETSQLPRPRYLSGLRNFAVRKAKAP